MPTPDLQEAETKPFVGAGVCLSSITSLPGSMRSHHSAPITPGRCWVVPAPHRAAPRQHNAMVATFTGITASMA